MTVQFEAQAADAVERELDLRSETDWFVDSEAQLKHLLAIARQAEFKNGEHLFEAGTPVDAVYLIISGDLELVADGQPSWKMAGSNRVGFLDLMMGKPHSRTAIARGEVRGLEIDASDFKEYMQDHVQLSQNTLSSLSAELFDEMLDAADPASLLGRPAEPTASTDDPPLVDRLLMLSRMPAFARASVQALANLVSNARVVRYAAGKEIASAGVRCDAVSVLLRGEVELVRMGDPPIRRGAGDLLCHVAEIATVPRRVSVRAVTESIVLQIDREELLDRMDEHFEVAQSLFAFLAGQRELLNNVAANAGKPL